MSMFDRAWRKGFMGTKALILVSILMSSIFVILIPVHSVAAEPVRVYVDPPTIIDPSTFFNVSVKLENVQELAGLELILSWDPLLLYGVNMTEVIFHETVPQSEWDNIWRLGHKIDNVIGEAWYAYTYVDSNRATLLGYCPISGNFTIFVITFQVRSVGNCTLHVKDSKLATLLVEPIIHELTDGFFSNSIPPPPIIPSPGSIAQVSLYVEPHGTKSESFTPNSTFSVAIKLDSIANHTGIVGFDITLYWNATLLECINVTEVMFHEVIPETDWTGINTYTDIYTYTQDGVSIGRLLSDNSVDNETLGKYGPVFGNHTAAVVTFRVINVGKCPLYLEGGVLENMTVSGIMPYTARSGYFSNVMSGDVNGDGGVDVFDALLLAKSFGALPGLKSWNEDADINGDGFIDIYDAISLCSHFGH